MNEKLIAAVLALSIVITAQVARAQTPAMLLHQFVTRPLSDTEKQVLAVANGCMAIAESPDDDWDRFLDLIEHNKNEFAYDLGFIVLECREQPDRVEQLNAALAGMIDRDANGFLEALSKHPLKGGELTTLLGSVEPTESANRFSILQRRLDRVESVYDPMLKPLRDRVAAELERLLGINPAATAPASSVGPPGEAPRPASSNSAAPAMRDSVPTQSTY